MFGFWCKLLISVLLKLSYFFKLLYTRSNVCYYIMFSLKVVIDMSTHWDTKSHSFRFYFPFSGCIRICNSCLPLLQDFEDFWRGGHLSCITCTYIYIYRYVDIFVNRIWHVDMYIIDWLLMNIWCMV